MGMADDDLDEAALADGGEAPDPDEAALDDLDEEDIDEEDIDDEDIDVALDDDDEVLDDEVLEDEDDLAVDTPVVTHPPPAREDDEEEDDDEEADSDDVEASLDVILKERLVVADEEEDDDEEPEGDDRPDSPLKVLPKQPGEFVCQSCFLVKHPSQLADPEAMYCRDCV
ncbi:MAG TPA: DUF4193 family protein [Acidimicrobiales bacterium]|jgi:hypothetical protein|nr:DUF4193 family protein [Acidimicrobiales bacterium]